ncbi:MAG TPA: type IV secretory system conjugative DNA transfer family protein [Acidimicrobiales bacterium]|nr:type IV secretory system conjugative DNA transfer family protein [Acidimicrobiales bacterium]
MTNDRPVLGRRHWQGLSIGPPVTLDPSSSLLIVGPTQAGKTSSLVIPALLRWSGALVVTSVKRDVVETTLGWRRTLGQVQVLEPGREGGLTWDPLEGVTTLRHATRVARDLTIGSNDRGDVEFWNALATKLVAGLMMLAKDRGRTIFDVSKMVEDHDVDSWLGDRSNSLASDAVRSFLAHDPKTLDGVFTTAETMLMPWRFPQPLAQIRSVLAGANTLYLCASRSEQRHYEPLFRGALRMVLEEQQRQVDEGRSRRVLMVLDEAATVASLDELDQLAATVSGLNVTLVTVVQDFAQLVARWGARAATIVNNHTTRVVLAGLADPTLGTYLPELVDASNDTTHVGLRLHPKGTAMVVSGGRRVYGVRLRPWWRYRQLRRRGVGGR